MLFTPHLVPMDRGILTTAYSLPRGEVNEERLFKTFREFYAEQPFVRVVDHLPGTKDTSGSNFCDITVRAGPRARADDQLLGQPDQRGIGRGGAEFQLDVRASGNARALLLRTPERHIASR